MRKGLVAIALFVSLSLHSQALEITELTNFWDGNLVIGGIIKNETDQTVSFVSLSLICRDENKNMVHTDSTYAFSPLVPGQEIPFKFLLSQADAEGVKNYSVSIDNYNRGGSGTFNFNFGQVSITEKNSSFHKYSGEITSLNENLVQYVSIAFLGFDENGKFIYVDTTYPKKTSLAHNVTSLFEFLVPPSISTKIKTYRCIGYAN